MVGAIGVNNFFSFPLARQLAELNLEKYIILLIALLNGTLGVFFILFSCEQTIIFLFADV